MFLGKSFIYSFEMCSQNFRARQVNFFHWFYKLVHDVSSLIDLYLFCYFSRDQLLFTSDFGVHLR